MKLLVCGSRAWDDPETLCAVLDAVDCREKVTEVIHGGARGADAFADAWAHDRQIIRSVYRPDWGRHGKIAGLMRNQAMLDDGKPDLVIAFRVLGKSTGTDDMVSRANKAGVRVEMHVAGGDPVGG